MALPCPALPCPPLSPFLWLPLFQSKKQERQRGKGWSGWLSPCLALFALCPDCVYLLSSVKERERERQGERRKKWTAMMGVALPCHDLPASRSLSVSVSFYVLSNLFQRDRDQAEKGGNGCRPALPSLPSTLLAYLSHPSVKEKERERGEERKRKGRAMMGMALPCRCLPLSLSLAVPSQQEKKKEKGIEGRLGVDGCRLALPSLPSALLAAVSHPSVQERERRGREKERARLGVALHCLACLSFSLSLSQSKLFTSLPERKRQRGREGRTGVDDGRPALPSPPSALPASLSLTLL